MADNPRIEELRRRVQKDPASIAFAQLAEELRRAGDYEDAIQVCRSGLEQHPGYLSARVTLGRALLETGEHDDAQTELEDVLRAAPDNLAAIRALAEIHQRRENGDQGSGIRDQENAIGDQGSADLDLQETDGQFSQALDTLGGMGFRDQGSGIGDQQDAASPTPSSDPKSLIPDPRLTALESWLAAIVADRDSRQAVTARSTQ